VGDPAREEERGGRGRQRDGVLAGNPEEVARVIERHDDHDRAAQHVHRRQPAGGCCRDRPHAASIPAGTRGHHALRLPSGRGQRSPGRENAAAPRCATPRP
jgi:hypothetical protein